MALHSIPMNGKNIELMVHAIDKITPYKNNPKDHPVIQIKSIKKSMDQFGFKQPIVIDKDNVIVAGHARFEAAKALKYKEILCVSAADLTADEIKAYRILDNELAKQGSTNTDLLLSEIADLPDFDFSEFNLDLPTIEILNEGLCDEDEVPEVAAEPVTKLGDIWILGNHRLMCGNSIMIDNLDLLCESGGMKPGEIDLVFTDPPYGINEKTDRVKASRGHATKAGKYNAIIGDESTQTAIDAYNLCESLSISTMLFWGANHYCHSLPETPNWLVWDKREDNKQRDGNSDCELAWIKSKAKSVRIFRHLWKGMIKASENGEGRVHPTQKPIALAEWCFNEYAKESKNVIDLFGGSGSTLIACEKTNRQCFMMELSESYCDIIIRRFQKFSGKDAILESNGKTFNELV
jgi:DNA modification methylase